jgi:DNA-binding transcriptional LysR family regulator
MARSEWLRTFLAIYRAGSVSEGARQRNLSQPAASQQLAQLERTIGSPLFARTPAGVAPTARGRELYLETAEAMDHLEAVLAGLDAGAVPAPRTAVRFGSSAEYFSAVLLPRLVERPVRVAARFAPDAELLALLEQAELDVVVTAATPSRRSADFSKVGDRRFVLVSSPDRRPRRRPSLATLADWLVDQPWVSYSSELPITRRFWLQHLGRRFTAELRLVAPDLRVVLAAVEAGMGVSLLPEFVCTGALAARRVVEVFPVADLVPAEPFFAAVRQGEVGRPEVADLLARLAERRG